MVDTWLAELPHGIRLSCRSAGAPGRPVLMFLHGFPEAAFVWDEMLLHFSRPEHGGYRCIAPNLRGYEQSSAPADVGAYRAKHLMEDLGALIAQQAPDGQLEALIAHDWGGAVAWSLASAQPERMRRLVIINSPHPQTFARELRRNPRQQAASAYMNFLIRPDAEALLAENDFARMWGMFTRKTGAVPSGQSGQPVAVPAWMTDAMRAQYRAVWHGTGDRPGAGLTGGLNYYRASPLRPPTASDPAAAAVELPPGAFTIQRPTLVLWAMQDIALPPELIDGLERWVPDMRLIRIEEATHWVVHERFALLAQQIEAFLKT